MTTLLERATQLFDKTNEVLDRAIRERTAREAQVQQAISSMQSTMLMPYIGYYDDQPVSKNSAAITADPANASHSNWFPVPNTRSHHLYPIEGRLIIVRLLGAYSYEPGHYESPQYSNDKSKTIVQFIYANDAITTLEINARLAALGIGDDLPYAGAWWDGTQSIRTTAVINKAHHPYSRLYARFLNVTVYGDGAPQNIVAFGGNASFAVNSVLHYPSLEF